MVTESGHPPGSNDKSRARARASSVDRHAVAENDYDCNDAHVQAKRATLPLSRGYQHLLRMYDELAIKESR